MLRGVNPDLSSNKAMIFLSVYFMASIVLMYVAKAYGIKWFALSINYIHAAVELYVTFYLVCMCNRGIINLNINGVLSLIILSSSVLFTMAQSSIADSVLAIPKNFNIVFQIVIISSFSYSENTVKRLLRFFVAFGVVAMIVSVVIDDQLQNLANMQNAYSIVAKSFWNGKNQYARYLMLSFFCAMALLIVSKKENGIFSKRICVVAIILAIGAILAFSRAVLLAVVIFLTFFILLTGRINKKASVAIVFLACVLILIIINNTSLRDFTERIVLRQQTSNLESRTTLWDIGFNYIAQHPIVGCGEFMVDRILKESGSIISEFHNAYINRLVVSGIPITLLYAVIIIKKVIELWKKRRSNSLTNISIACLFALMSYMVFESYQLFSFSLDGFIVMTFLYIVPNMPNCKGNHCDKTCSAYI